MMDSNYFSENKNVREEINSLQKRIKDIKENINLIEEKKSKFVKETDIPIQLDKEQKALEKELNKLENELDSKQNIIKQQPKVPKFLPYLPNRKQQESILDKLLQDWFLGNNNKPLVCIVHGDKSQGHDTFLERTREVFLPTRFKPDERCPIKKYSIRFPKHINNKDDFHTQLRNTLATEITNYSFNSLEQINNSISNAPTMIYVNLSVEEWYQLEIDIIGFFMDFWQKWTSMCSGQFLMVCLSIKYPTEENLSFCKRYRLRRMKRKFISRLEQFVNSKLIQLDQIIGTVLPELKGIRQEHVEDWLSIEVKKQFQDDGIIEHLDNQIKFLYKKWRKQNPSNGIPMNYLAGKLRKLLQGDFLDEEEIV